MLKFISTKVGYAVVFDEIPTLPIEAPDVDPSYVKAFSDAVETGFITKTGLYFIRPVGDARTVSRVRQPSSI